MHTHHLVRKRKVWPWWPGAIGQQAEMPSVLFRLPGITQDFLQQGMGPPGVHPQSVGNMGFTPVAGITQPPPPPNRVCKDTPGAASAGALPAAVGTGGQGPPGQQGSWNGGDGNNGPVQTMPSTITQYSRIGAHLEGLSPYRQPGDDYPSVAMAMSSQQGPVQAQHLQGGGRKPTCFPSLLYDPGGQHSHYTPLKLLYCHSC